jgi:hypothetical protein
MLENPLIVMFELDNKIVCHIHRHKSAAEAGLTDDLP